MALKIKPLADRVLIEPMAAETKTASGIIIHVSYTHLRDHETGRNVV